MPFPDRRERRRSSPVKEAAAAPPPEEEPAKLLDNLFNKTKAQPHIYWLPLTDQQASCSPTFTGDAQGVLGSMNSFAAIPSAQLIYNQRE